ncbi:DUF5954 family protein [Streptomyces sp. NPDC001941]|uniref:DUF5954 family protein n=1 Tax=Streptomyces sp. NPDC001941 TaxID=3154659 RepID=UPI00331A34FC
MDQEHAGPEASRPLVVRLPVEPVEAAVEADALDAAARTHAVAVRGPVFGVAARRGGGTRWRVVVPLTAACGQEARDSLNSHLWFRAKDEARDRAERAALLAAVARLESERIDELTVEGRVFRVVRAEEYAATGAFGIELPRPTDPEPLRPDWARSTTSRDVDQGLVLDMDAPVRPSQAAEMLALRDLCYSGARFPADVLDDSRAAVDTHPDVLLLPATFAVMEQDGEGWKPYSGPHPSAHEARKSLDFALTWMQPRLHGLIPVSGDPGADARTFTAGDRAAAVRLAAYAQAADRLRAGRVNQLDFQGTVYRVARTRRLVRWGPDGPEGPRRSDPDSHEPCRLHPPMDEDGKVLPEPEAGEGEGEGD